MFRRRRTPESDAPQAGPAAANSDPVPDMTPPAPQRQQELRDAAAANRAREQPPYAGVRIATRGELDWIMTTEGWRGDYDGYYVRYTLIPRGEIYIPADLRGANLGKVALGDVRLRLADFRGANLVYAGLRGAHLRDAQFDQADIGFADFEGAELDYSSFATTRMRRVNLSHAIVKYSTLIGARLHQANLTSADLHGARFDEATILSEAKLDSGTRLGDVIWDDAGLTRINWNSLKRFGDEAKIAAADNRAERLEAEDLAVRAYLQLALALQEQGVTDAAARYAIRGQQLRRRLLRHRWRLFAWIASWVLAIASGYGYRLWRIFVTYVIIVLVCAVVYFGLGWYGYGPSIQPQEALLASVTAFHGRVFSEEFSLQSPQAWVAAIEAILGFVVEGIFIAMLVQRVFNR